MCSVSCRHSSAASWGGLGYCWLYCTVLWACQGAPQLTTSGFDVADTLREGMLSLPRLTNEVMYRCAVCRFSMPREHATRLAACATKTFPSIARSIRRREPGCIVTPTPRGLPGSFWVRLGGYVWTGYSMASCSP